MGFVCRTTTSKSVLIINAGAAKCLRNILKTFVNIYVNEFKVHECALKNKDDPSIAADFSFDLCTNSSRRKKMTCNFQYIKN